MEQLSRGLPPNVPTLHPAPKELWDFSDAIVALSACHANIYVVSGSNQFSTATLTELVDPVQGLAHVLEYETPIQELATQIDDMADAFSNSVVKTIAHVYGRSVSDAQSLVQKGTLSDATNRSTDDAIATARKDCLPLLRYSCVDNELWDKNCNSILGGRDMRENKVQPKIKKALEYSLGPTLIADPDVSQRPYV